MLKAAGIDETRFSWIYHGISASSSDFIIMINGGILKVQLLYKIQGISQISHPYFLIAKLDQNRTGEPLWGLRSSLFWVEKIFLPQTGSWEMLPTQIFQWNYIEKSIEIRVFDQIFDWTPIWAPDLSFTPLKSPIWRNRKNWTRYQNRNC